MLNLGSCRSRSQRFAGRLREISLDAAICSSPQHVYYLTGHWTHWTHHGACIVWADGRVWLCTANQPNKQTAADLVVAYEANWDGTQRQDQPAVVAEAAIRALTNENNARIGIDASAVGSQVALWLEEVQPIDAELWQMRRRKDPDELQLMQQAIRCTEAMYVRARKIIRPGIGELDVFNQLQAEAIRAAGEPLTAPLGNDYRCAAGGGAPRAGRIAQPGELYIIDPGPAYRGYFADNARTFCVDGHPTEVQRAAWQDVVQCLAIVEKMARPGVSCREIYHAVDEHLRKARGQGLVHHLGHGVGLQPHEYPHLNLHWDDSLIEGEVFTAEPGIYDQRLSAGIRLENQYLVTADGVRNLVNHPLDLSI